MSSSLYPMWFQFAACRDRLDTMFPEPGDPGRAAKALCAQCPATKACLDYALREEIKHGVWGGYTPRERWLISRGLPPHLPKRSLARARRLAVVHTRPQATATHLVTTVGLDPSSSEPGDVAASPAPTEPIKEIL